jgi:hypothetical protein
MVNSIMILEQDYNMNPQTSIMEFPCKGILNGAKGDIAVSKATQFTHGGAHLPSLDEELPHRVDSGCVGIKFTVGRSNR